MNTELINNRMKDLRLNALGIAQALGISDRQFRRLKNNEQRLVDPGTLRVLADLLELSIDELVRS